MATVGEDHPEAKALLAKTQDAQNALSQLSVERKDQATIKAARDAMLQLKEAYKTLTGHFPKLELVKKEKPAAAEGATADGEAISKRCLVLSLVSGADTWQRAEASREGGEESRREAIGGGSCSGWS